MTTCHIILQPDQVGRENLPSTDLPARNFDNQRVGANSVAAQEE